MAIENFKTIYDQLDVLLSQTKLDDVSSESTGFAELPEGYYLCEVEKVELKPTKTTQLPMVAFQFTISEDGQEVVVKDDKISFKAIKGTKNRKIFVNYVLKDDRSVRRFAADMLKFEAEPGEPLLPKEAFTSSETIEDALDCLVGMRIYIQVSTTTNDDNTKSTWNNLISWKRAAILELPM